MKAPKPSRSRALEPQVEQSDSEPNVHGSIMTVEAMFDRCGGFPNSTFRKSKSDLIFFHGIDAGRLHFCQLITLHFSMDYSTSCGSFESFLSYSPTFTATLLMSCVFPSSSTLQQRI